MITLVLVLRHSTEKHFKKVAFLWCCTWELLWFTLLFLFFLLAAVDAVIGSVLVLPWTEFKAVHFTDYVLTSFGCARDYQSSSDFTGSHASGFDKVSTLNGNCDVLLSFVAFWFVVDGKKDGRSLWQWYSAIRHLLSFNVLLKKVLWLTSRAGRMKWILSSDRLPKWERCPLCSRPQNKLVASFCISQPLVIMLLREESIFGRFNRNGFSGYSNLTFWRHS